MPISVLALFITNEQLQYLRGLHLNNELTVRSRVYCAVWLFIGIAVLFSRNIVLCYRAEDPLICPLTDHPAVSVVIYYSYCGI